MGCYRSVAGEVPLPAWTTDAGAPDDAVHVILDDSTPLLSAIRRSSTGIQSREVWAGRTHMEGGHNWNDAGRE